jgi:hypothetical protein
MGLMIAFFLRGIFNRTLGLLIFVYWISLAGWYAGNLWLHENVINKPVAVEATK